MVKLLPVPHLLDCDLQLVATGPVHYRVALEIVVEEMTSAD
jgi:hypothetical protein